MNILQKISQYEQLEWWSKDVEDDPPTVELLPNKVDYTNKKLSSKFYTWIANICATCFFENQIKQKNLVIKKVIGLENYLSLKGGAIITCNHFNAFDNYALYRAIKKSMKGRRLYKVIREGNYTNFKGLYGFFFRHCNTLPLSSNAHAMKKFLQGISELLKRGEKILIYPEQGMWWNYKKPRPMQNGAFKLAVKNNAPILPTFITMEEGEKIGGDGFAIMEYTIHILPPMYPDSNLSPTENAQKLKNTNYSEWKRVYEEFYQQPLTYFDGKTAEEVCSI